MKRTMKDRRISKLIKNSILNLLYHAVLFGTINSLIWRTAVKRTMKDVLEDHKTRPLPTDPWARAAPLPMKEYGYPLFVAYKRHRMWVTRAISATLTSLASTLLEMAHPTFAADSAVTREFEVFCSDKRWFQSVGPSPVFVRDGHAVAGLKSVHRGHVRQWYFTMPRARQPKKHRPVC